MHCDLLAEHGFVRESRLASCVREHVGMRQSLGTRKRSFGCTGVAADASTSNVQTMIAAADYA